MDRLYYSPSYRPRSYGLASFSLPDSTYFDFGCNSEGSSNIQNPLHNSILNKIERPDEFNLSKHLRVGQSSRDQVLAMSSNFNSFVEGPECFRTQTVHRNRACPPVQDIPSMRHRHKHRISHQYFAPYNLGNTHGSNQTFPTHRSNSVLPGTVSFASTSDIETSIEDQYAMSSSEEQDGIEDEVDTSARRRRPKNVPYNRLLHQCLLSTAPHYEMTLQEIYDYFEKYNWREIRDNPSGCKCSIRHNLSMNAAFVNSRRANSRRSDDKAVWSLTDEAIVSEVLPTTHYRRTGRRANSQSKRKSISKRSKIAKSTKQLRSARRVPTSDLACEQDNCSGTSTPMLTQRATLSPVRLETPQQQIALDDPRMFRNVTPAFHPFSNMHFETGFQEYPNEFALHSMSNPNLSQDFCTGANNINFSGSGLTFWQPDSKMNITPNRLNTPVLSSTANTGMYTPITSIDPQLLGGNDVHANDLLEQHDFREEEGLNWINEVTDSSFPVPDHEYLDSLQF